jgi:hypothetical protein
MAAPFAFVGALHDGAPEVAPSSPAAIVAGALLREFVLGGANAAFPEDIANVFGVGGDGGASRAPLMAAWKWLLGPSGLLTALDVARSLQSGTVSQLVLGACQEAAAARPPLWKSNADCAEVARIAAATNDTAATASTFKPLTEDAIAGWSKDRVCFAETAFRSASAESDWAHGEAVQHKNAGNVHYTAGAFQAAIGCYAEGITALACATDSNGRTAAVRRWSWGLAAILHSNTAQAHLCAGDAASARRAAATALKFDPVNEKALHRKTTAEAALQAKLGTIEQSARESALKDMCGSQ